MLCCTVHCQWGRKPPELPLPLEFRHCAGGDRACPWFRGYRSGQTDRHTDVLITILPINIITTLVASSVKRNVTVWRPSVRLSRIF